MNTLIFMFVLALTLAICLLVVLLILLRLKPRDTNSAFMPKYTRVVLESPYTGDVQRNLEYARKCVKDSLDRGEAPIASHLLYTQEGILDDNVKSDRVKGIEAGLSWLDVAEKHVFYIDYGYSKGMAVAKEYYKINNIPVEERKIL